MCLIMMEMTDFTRGRGRLKTTMDVINAAKKISEAGTKLDKLARACADECPESSTKKDLIAYLQRIALYCHQLNITSKVKADVQNVSGELVVSGLDSATSLIQVKAFDGRYRVESSHYLVFAGSEELDERGGVDREGQLRGEHQVQEDQHRGGGQQSAGGLEDEGPGEEAASPEGGTRGGQGEDQEGSRSQSNQSEQSLVRF